MKIIGPYMLPGFENPHGIALETMRPAERMKIGTELHRIGQESGGMDDIEIRPPAKQDQGSGFRMIALDTNVLSEPLKFQPNPRVLAWLDSQTAETLYVSSISYAELRIGVLQMSDGKRKNALLRNIRQVLDLFRDRTLPFDIEAAEHLAKIVVQCDEVGRPATAPDPYIAAIAAAVTWRTSPPIGGKGRIGCRSGPKSQNRELGTRRLICHLRLC